MLKLAINPETLEVKSNGEAGHYTYLTAKTFDKWVRCIYWPEHKRIYFRFYKPDGDYSFTSDTDDKRARIVCARVLSSLIVKRLVSKTVKPLYWETDAHIKDFEIRS